ncbi:MAG: bifunctional tetrahydrofolate synthase/dihydrofolate synthase [Betaproteobacteria bacterium]|nr:bifunctional tetrahydrofolate synthase/dihydrofolate synthase [Betaproteobacteria bacterium]
MPTLADWLAHAERLHPKGIAMGLDRIREVAGRLDIRFDCPVITVGGTNGKGSTCAMLESILLSAGYRVALHTSPHLLDFNERARFQGAPADDAPLARHMAEVEAARGQTLLTYFEFTLLAILRWFQSCQPDVVILEVGLGGRLDGVNLIDADCAIVTCIDIDHAEYLGDTRELIAHEKAHIYRPGRPAICADPMPPATLIRYAEGIGADLRLFGRDFNYSGDRQQWAWGGRSQRRAGLAYPALRGSNQLLNASGVLAALEALRERLPVSQQAVRQGLATVELPGRFQVLPGRPAVVLDVAHNPHAAAHLAQNLDNMGFFPVTWAVFGAMRDKDLAGIVGHLRERVDHWLLTSLPGPRAATAAELRAGLAALGIEPGPQRQVRVFDAPRDALAHARAGAEEGDRILAFGSFLTVADILASRRSPGGAT